MTAAALIETMIDSFIILNVLLKIKTSQFPILIPHFYFHFTKIIFSVNKLQQKLT